MVDNEDAAKSLNRFRGFFLPARNSLLNMALMQFAKVFDKHKSTVSLRNLIEAAESDPINLAKNAVEGELENIKLNIASNEKLLEDLKTYRDKRLAHHDFIAPSDTHLQYGKIRDLVKSTQSAYNQLTKYFDSSITIFESLEKESERHTREVIELMMEERAKIRNKPYLDNIF